MLVVAELKLETGPLAPVLEPTVPQVSLSELPWMGPGQAAGSCARVGPQKLLALTVVALLCFPR